jgi:hypothetical protein
MYVIFGIICDRMYFHTISPTIRHAGAKGEKKYSSYSFLTSALDGVRGQRQSPAALYSQERYSRYLLDRRLGRPQIRSGHRG